MTRPCCVCGKAFTGDDYSRCRIITVFPAFVMHGTCEDAFWASKGTMFDLTEIKSRENPKK